jgi:hypothetical protein
VGGSYGLGTGYDPGDTNGLYRETEEGVMTGWFQILLLLVH